MNVDAPIVNHVLMVNFLVGRNVVMLLAKLVVERVFVVR